MSDTRTRNVRTGAGAVILYGDDQALPGTVSRVVTTRTGNLRRVGIIPDGTNVVAWFTPAPDMEGLVSVGGSTVAYV